MYVQSVICDDKKLLGHETLAALTVKRSYMSPAQACQGIAARLHYPGQPDD